MVKQAVSRNKILSFDKTYIQHSIVDKQQHYKFYLEHDSNVTLYINDLSLQQDVFVDTNENLLSYNIILEERAHCTIFIAMVSNENITIDIHCDILGSDATFNIIGVYALADQQTIKITTKQIHNGARTKSSVLLHGILKDHATMSYNGLIFIGESAKQTHAEQQHKNIIVSKQAQVTSIPSIEVLQHDVRCFHGSAVGKFNDEQLWYLQSRGLHVKEAYRLLVHSFFSKCVENFIEPELLLEKLCRKII